MRVTLKNAKGTIKKNRFFANFHQFQRKKAKNTTIRTEIGRYGDERKLSKKFKVLLVEDCELIQMIALLHLSSAGYEADLAKDGHEALEKFNNGYDFILLDIDLPYKSGLEVAHEIRNYEKNTGCKRHRLIAVTAGHNEQECLNAGIDKFLPKPYDKEQLENVLKEFSE